MKEKMLAVGFLALSVFTLVLGGVSPAHAQGDASTTVYEGTLTRVDPASETVAIKTGDGAVYTFRVARSFDLRFLAVGDKVQAEAVPNWGIVLTLKKIAAPAIDRSSHTP